MKRRTLDIIFAAGGVLLAALLVVLGFVLADQQSFAKDYVKGELSAQKISFAPAENLKEEEKNWKPGSVCLVENAGKTMETGKQAECYAKYYIAFHMTQSATTAGFPGETYATLGPIRTDLATQVKTAKDKNDTATADAAQKKLDSATALRGTMQTGETLRGLLLTTYGFSIFGNKAALAANVLFVLAGLMLVLSIAGFVHAFVTPKEKVVGVLTAPTAAGSIPREA